MPERISKTQKAALREQCCSQEAAQTNPFYRAVEEVQPELVKLARNMVHQAEQLAVRYEGAGSHITSTDVLAVAFDYAVKQGTGGKALTSAQSVARVATTIAMLLQGIDTQPAQPTEQEITA